MGSDKGLPGDCSPKQHPIRLVSKPPNDRQVADKKEQKTSSGDRWKSGEGRHPEEKELEIQDIDVYRKQYDRQEGMLRKKKIVTVLECCTPRLLECFSS
jgi:hypothetical protein